MIINKLKNMREESKIVLLALLVITLIAYTSTVVHPNYGALKSAVFSGNNKLGVPIFKKNRTPPKSQYDFTTHKGWRGKVNFDNSSDALVMKLTKYNGQPVNGLFIAAQIFSFKGGHAIYRNLLDEHKDGTYRSAQLNIGKGKFDLTLTARDPESTAYINLLFRIEKRIIIN